MNLKNLNKRITTFKKEKVTENFPQLSSVSTQEKDKEKVHQSLSGLCPFCFHLHFLMASGPVGLLMGLWATCQSGSVCPVLGPF